MIKRCLISCKTQRFKADVVEKVANKIKQELEKSILDLECKSALISPDKVINFFLSNYTSIVEGLHFH